MYGEFFGFHRALRTRDFFRIALWAIILGPAPTAMERRHFLYYVAGGICGLQAPLGDAGAGTQCTGGKRARGKVCTISVSRELPRVVVHPGKNPVAAGWIASLHMIFQYHGYSVAPARIAKEAYSGVVPPMPWLHPEAVCRTWVADKGPKFVSRVEAVRVRAADAAEALAEDQPLIVGVAGRPEVLTALTYTGDRLGGMTLVQALTCDPLGGKHPHTVTSPEWVDVRFIMRVSLSKVLAQR